MFCLDLILLFKLISRVPDAIGALGDIVENHIHQTGLNAIEKISEIALTVNLHLIIYSFFIRVVFVFRIRAFISKLFWIFIRNS